MHQLERHGDYPLATQQPHSTQTIELHGQLYQLVQAPQSSHPTQATQQGYLAEQPPQYINPRPIAPYEPLKDWRLWAFVGGCFFVVSIGTYAIVKSAMPPPAPVVMPPAAPAPAPVTIIQAPPPPPPPRPFTEKICRPAGWFGGEVCDIRQGYQ